MGGDGVDRRPRRDGRSTLAVSVPSSAEDRSPGVRPGPPGSAVAGTERTFRRPPGVPGTKSPNLDGKASTTTSQRRRPGPVLVVGATGMIGAQVVHHLLRSGVPVTTLSRRPYARGAVPPEELRVVRGDARDPTVLAQALEGAEQVVYALSAGVPQFPSPEPFADVQHALEPLLSVLSAMRGPSARRIFFLSSGGAVYGNPTSVPVPESAATDPISAYGVLKLAAEKYVAMYCRLHGMSYCVLRAGNVYGHGQAVVPGHGAVTTILRAAAAGQTLQVYGDGHGLRDYVFAADVGWLLARLVQRSALPSVLNVGTGTGTSVLQLVAAVEEVTGRHLSVKHLPARSFDVASVVLDISKLRALVEWAPTPLQTGVGETWRRLVSVTSREVRQTGGG